VFTGKSEMVSFTVEFDTLLVNFSHSGHALLYNVIVTSSFSGLDSREIGVASRSIPIT